MAGVCARLGSEKMAAAPPPHNDQRSLLKFHFCPSVIKCNHIAHAAKPANLFRPLGVERTRSTLFFTPFRARDSSVVASSPQGPLSSLCERDSREAFFFCMAGIFFLTASASEEAKNSSVFAKLESQRGLLTMLNFFFGFSGALDPGFGGELGAQDRGESATHRI